MIAGSIMFADWKKCFLSVVHYFHASVIYNTISESRVWVGGVGGGGGGEGGEGEEFGGGKGQKIVIIRLLSQSWWLHHIFPEKTGSRGDSFRLPPLLLLNPSLPPDNLYPSKWTPSTYQLPIYLSTYLPTCLPAYLVDSFCHTSLFLFG